jgi:hypothetical protein
MLGATTQIGLIVTGLLSILISIVTALNPIGSKPVGKLWIGVNLSLALWSLPWCFGAFYVSDSRLSWLAIYLASLCAILLPPLFLSFAYSLLERPFRESRFIKWAWLLSFALLLLCIAFPHQFFKPGVRKVVDASLPSGGMLLWIFSVQYTVLFSAGVFALIMEARRLPKGSQRNKIAYVILGVAIGSGGGVTTFLTPLGIYPYGIVFVPCYSLIITYAITRYRLLDIAVVIRKTLIYSFVTGGLALIYLGIVTLFANVFTGLTGYQTVFSSAVAACLVTLGFQPLRKKVQAFVDGKFFRQYVDREEKLYELSREVITHTTSEAMAQSLIRVLADTLHPKSTALYLRARDGDGFVLISNQLNGQLPERMPESNALASFFADHPQPFIQQELPSGVGESLNTRRPTRKEDAA